MKLDVMLSILVSSALGVAFGLWQGNYWAGAFVYLAANTGQGMWDELIAAIGATK